MKQLIRFSVLILFTLILTPLTALLQAQTCPELVTDALSVVETACDGTRPDYLCYGHNLLHVIQSSIATAEPDAFESPGDRIALRDIENLQLSAMDAEAGVWGISLMRLRAGAVEENALGNMTILAFGDVEIHPADTSALQPMQAFYFSSNDTTTACANVPLSGILIQTAEGVGQLRLTINGVDVEIGSTAFFQAQPGGAMTVSLIEGHTTLTAMGISQTVLPGTQVSIPLDLNLAPQNVPSVPVRYDQMVIGALPVQLLDRAVTVTAITASLNGQIQAINGEIVTVNDISVQFPPDDPRLQILNEGDFVTVEGNFDNTGTTVVLVVVNIAIIDDVMVIHDPNCSLHVDGMGMGYWLCNPPANSPTGMGMGDDGMNNNPPPANSPTGMGDDGMGMGDDGMGDDGMGDDGMGDDGMGDDGMGMGA